MKGCGMMVWEMIDMTNPNVLVALAYIKTNDNPLYVFSRYILYALQTASTSSLRADELRSKLAELFGLPMPQQMINTCIRILKKEGEVDILPNGEGYVANKDRSQFDVARFENDILRLHAQETAVLTAMINFIKEKYDVVWTQEEAKTYLSQFLDEEGNGARIFINEEIVIDTKRVSPSWYVGRYISFVQQNGDSIEKTYLEEIVNGMMIYQGVYQTNDYLQDKDQKFKGTTFYFDTKLILRILGYSWDANVQSARELAQLITKEYGGKVGVFSQTLKEVENALYRAGKNLKAINDFELQIYAKLNPTGASLLCEASTAVLGRLSSEFGISISPEFDWNSEKVKKNTIEMSPIVDYIQEKHELWRRGTIEYDVEIINQINILRSGDYSVRFGGKKKLPVFVTTNAPLVHTFRDYIVDVLEHNSDLGWRTQALPIITDNMILFRLWTPVADRYSKLPALTLARYAYAAQNPTTQYFSELKERTLSYQKEKGVDLFNLPEIRRQQLEDILVVGSEGDVDQLTDELVATSVDELVKMQNISLHEEVDSLTGTVNMQGEILEKKDARIVELVSKPYVNRLGILRLPILASKFWWFIAMLVLYFVTDAIVSFLGQNITIPYIVAALPLIAQIILLAIDKWLDKKDMHRFLTKVAVKYVWKHYVDRVISKLSEEDFEIKESVILYCRDNTKLFKKYAEYCDYCG